MQVLVYQIGMTYICGLLLITKNKLKTNRLWLLQQKTTDNQEN